MNLLAALLLLLAASAEAHPGRLDASGCHQVRKDFVYVDGRTARKGEVHCHRTLGGMKLDGREVLTEPGEDRTAEPEEDKDEPTLAP